MTVYRDGNTIYFISEPCAFGNSELSEEERQRIYENKYILLFRTGVDKIKGLVKKITDL